MAELEQVGHDTVSARDLFVFEAADALRVQQITSPWPNRFVCLLAWNARSASVDEVSSLAHHLLRLGCCYICCWGERCSWVHDVFDEVALERGEAAPLLMSTWHADEPLADAIWFSLLCASPHEAFGPCSAVVAISIANSAWASEFRRALSDPIAFSRELSGEP